MMRRSLFVLVTLAVLPGSGCATHRAAAPASSPASVAAAPCDMKSARPWIERWLGAWELASERLLKLPEAPAPELVLYDGTCAWTTSAVTAGGAPIVDGPSLHGAKLPWRALPHGGSLKLPDGSETPIQLMSFTNVAKDSGPFFVMAAPVYWKTKVPPDPSEYTGVFLHEFAHTRQVAAVGAIIGPIDATWQGPDELDDDAVQKRFAEDPEYVAAYTAERDLLYRAADAATDTEARALAAEALAMMRSRHARWLTGDDAVYATLDNVFLSMEGVGQWTAYAWLSHPEDGGLDRQSAITKMLGRRRWWTQDEGLALFLVIDRLLPGWPALAFDDTSPGALDLLERAVSR
ncbi:MAG: hypothetical protein ACSLFQ_17065 [Thermoanaerobaculia bacterium]